MNDEGPVASQTFEFTDGSAANAAENSIGQCLRLRQVSRFGSDKAARLASTRSRRP
jgi:chromosome condensin MukBEF complex kleisin-like MukF subunit